MKMSRKQAKELTNKIEEFVKEIEKQGVKITGWDDEYAYFNHPKFQMRVKHNYDTDVHDIETHITTPYRGR